MKTYTTPPRWCFLLAVASFLYGVTLEAYSATLALTNDSADHDLRAVIYYEDVAISNVTTPSLTVVCGPSSNIVQLVPHGKAVMYFQYANTGSGSWVTQESVGSDPHYQIGQNTNLFFWWGGGSPDANVFETNGVYFSGASSSSDVTAEQMEVFWEGAALGFSTVLLVLFGRLARSLGSSNKGDI